MFAQEPWQERTLKSRRCDDPPGTSARKPFHVLGSLAYIAVAMVESISNFFSYLFARSSDLKTRPCSNASRNGSGTEQLNKPSYQGREDPLLRLVTSEIELALIYASIARRSQSCGDFVHSDFAIRKAEISHFNASRWIAAGNGPNMESLSTNLRELRSVIDQLRASRDERNP
jgi:hypothetical protein